MPRASQKAAAALLNTRREGLNLFLVGFLVLFLELACIRWFSAYVIFLQFFSNIILMACFLGMSCGCMAARQKRDWFACFPVIASINVVAALAIFNLYLYWGGFAIDVGQHESPQEIFFGTEYRSPDVAKFVLPIEAVAALFFILIALMFVGLGQVLGRCFDAYPDRVRGYTLNIGGSLAGIAGFSVLSFLKAPPIVWFSVSFAGIAYLLYQNGTLTRSRMRILLVLLIGIAILPVLSSNEIKWSPYYQVIHDKTTDEVVVNTIGHQQMISYERDGSAYSLIHLLQQNSGGIPFRDVLVIGAGSGNDVAHALRFAAERIDAVEIDPVIHDIGVGYHPDHPFQDARVVSHLDDGRHFLRRTDRKFDLIVYALVDSLMLHSSYANIRLESYLFTMQAFEDIRRALKPDGVFVMYNFYRQGWIVQRVSEMARQIFGCKPVVLSLPYVETLKTFDPAGFTTIIAGCNSKIATAFDRYGSFWLNGTPPLNAGVNGFTFQPESLTAEQAAKWSRIAPTKLVHEGREQLQTTTDDWPFLYIEKKTIPDLAVRSMILLGLLGMGMVYAFLPKGEGKIRINTRMFFLGAGFMLLETKAVVQLALLFGSTWLVNTAVFFAVLLLILLANLYVMKATSIRLAPHYAALLLFLACTVLLPFDIFLSGNVFWRYALPCALALGPVFFAGVVFARSFRDEPNPDHAFGSNIAGSVVGGLAESFSTLVGFRYLLVLAIGFYLLSAVLPFLRYGSRRLASIGPFSGGD